MRKHKLSLLLLGGQERRRWISFQNVDPSSCCWGCISEHNLVGFIGQNDFSCIAKFCDFCRNTLCVNTFDEIVVGTGVAAVVWKRTTWDYTGWLITHHRLGVKDNRVGLTHNSRRSLRVLWVSLCQNTPHLCVSRRQNSHRVCSIGLRLLSARSQVRLHQWR